MATELPYLNSYKNVPTLFQKIGSAKRPEAFTTRFLSDTLGLKGSGDRALIPLLRTLGFIDQAGRPTAAYGSLKNTAQARAAMAAAIRRAYEPLFSANESAHTLSGESLRGLIAQVAGTDSGMTSKIAGTFNSLIRLADFDAAQSGEREKPDEQVTDDKEEEDRKARERRTKLTDLRTEFHYNIQVHLPANGTEETYLNIFNAIRKTFR